MQSISLTFIALVANDGIAGDQHSHVTVRSVRIESAPVVLSTLVQAHKPARKYSIWAFFLRAASFAMGPAIKLNHL
jgi:hypothetical protein